MSSLSVFAAALFFAHSTPCAAGVAVGAPAGDAPLSVRTAVAEAVVQVVDATPSTRGFDAAFEISVFAVPEGFAVELWLTPADGSARVTDRRVVPTDAETPSVAASMARAVLATYLTPKGAQPPPPAAVSPPAAPTGTTQVLIPAVAYAGSLGAGAVQPGLGGGYMDDEVTRYHVRRYGQNTAEHRRSLRALTVTAHLATWSGVMWLLGWAAWGIMEGDDPSAGELVAALVPGFTLELTGIALWVVRAHRKRSPGM